MLYSASRKSINNMFDSTPPFSDIFFISNLVKVLNKVEKRKELTQVDRTILERGTQLVTKIIEGAKVVEKTDTKNAVYSFEEGITAYGYALATIENLDWLKEADDSTLFFEEMRKKLENVENSSSTQEDVSFLKEFFLALGDSFRGDIYRREYIPPKTFPTLTG